MKLTSSATTSSVLDTDVTDGLQMVIDKCSVAWTESGSTPYTYTCGGTTSSVLASQRVIGSDLTLSNLGILTAADPDPVAYLRLTLTLPTSADNDFQNKSSTLSYAFTGTQRAAASK